MVVFYFILLFSSKPFFLNPMFIKPFSSYFSFILFPFLPFFAIITLFYLSIIFYFHLSTNRFTPSLRFFIHFYLFLTFLQCYNHGINRSTIEFVEKKTKRIHATKSIDFVKQLKTCPYCNSNECRYLFLNNGKATQPRYQC